MFSSFKLPSLRSRKNSETSEKGDTVKISKTPTGTPITSKRHHRRSSDAGGCPSIASLRPGSTAYNSDQLMPGDRIQNINGINTNKLRNDDVMTLLNNVDERALLEIEYSLPDSISQTSMCITTKVTDITVEREDGSLGITLRGGVHGDPQLTRALIITHIRPHGPAHKTGLIKAGDRLLKVDNQSLTNKTLLEAQKILTQQIDMDSSRCSDFTNQQTILTIEYDISVMESVKYATGPLLIEIERHFNEELGIILNNFNNTSDNGIYIENIIAASVADRCGALNVGDQILAINDIYIESTFITIEEVMCLLHDNSSEITRLQILPYSVTVNNTPVSKRSVSGVWAQHSTDPYNADSFCGYSTFNSRRSRIPTTVKRVQQKSKFIPKHNDLEGMNTVPNNYFGYSQLGVCHTETLNITLCSEGQGYGLTVDTEQTSPDQEANILITNIISNSIADRCGCLQVGDRLLSVNRQPNLTIQEINGILEKGFNSKTFCKLELQVEFDVADSIVPSSGIFTVKIAKQISGLGITITASKINPDDPFIISDIRRGSIAHRIGTLHIGDRLLAINNRNLDHKNLEQAFEILQNSPYDIIILKIEKVSTVPIVSNTDSNFFSSDDVVYTVELIRYGGPLGITISGSEDCTEPIILSRLIEGGLAEKTGALHVGDRIIAINGESLINRPLSVAIRLLQCSGDRVQLKISRCAKEPHILCESIRRNYPSPGVQSIDSAVESWTSSTVLENNIKIDSQEETNSLTLTEESPILSNNDCSTSTTTLTMIEDVKLDDNNENHLKQSRINMSEQNIQYYSDTDDVFCPSPLLPLPNYTYTNSLQNKYNENSLQLSSSVSPHFDPIHKQKNDFSERLQSSSSLSSAISLNNYDIYHVILYKDAVYDDYGFSVSDGLYEKGVFINRIRKGGPADIVGLLRPYDRILQVNDTKTQDFDCCLTVPLIASAGDRIELVVARNPTTDNNKVLSWITEEQEISNVYPHFGNLSSSQSTITKTL